jgi:uncharacterized protein YoxC
MVTKEQIDRIVTAIEEVGGAIGDNSTVEFSVDDYNMLSSIGENLESIANTLKKIEAKIK